MANVQCVNCSYLNLKAAGRMAYQGCGVCVHDAPCTYYSANSERECSKFETAAADVVAMRVEWLQRTEA